MNLPQPYPCSFIGFRSVSSFSERQYACVVCIHAVHIQGSKHSVATEYMLRMLGLEPCADIVVGNQLARGISGGQRKRVTCGEMLVSSKKARSSP